MEKNALEKLIAHLYENKVILSIVVVLIVLSYTFDFVEKANKAYTIVFPEKKEVYIKYIGKVFCDEDNEPLENVKIDVICDTIRIVTSTDELGGFELAFKDNAIPSHCKFNMYYNRNYAHITSEKRKLNTDSLEFYMHKQSKPQFAPVITAHESPLMDIIEIK